MKRYIKHIWRISSEANKISIIVLLMLFVTSVIEKNFLGVVFNAFAIAIVIAFISQDYINIDVERKFKDIYVELRNYKRKKHEQTRIIFECMECKTLSNELKMKGDAVTCIKCGSEKMKALMVEEDE